MGNTIPEIRRKIWLADRPRTPPIVTMLSIQERRLLHFLARRHFSNRGAIVDAGCFLGGSTVALAQGLRAWTARSRAAPAYPIQTYDLFMAEAWTIGTLLPDDLKAGDSFRALFDRNLFQYRDLIDVHQGDITATTWPGWPIEILFIDCAKVPSVNDFIARTFFPRLIPGVSIVIQQDYIFDSWNAWIHLTMERLADYFEILTDTGIGSVVYLNTRGIPAAEITAATACPMPAEEKIALLDRARSRFRGVQAAMLQRSHASYLSGPVWCTGCDAAGHLGAFTRIAKAELERLRPISGPNLAPDIDGVAGELTKPGGELTLLQADVNRLIAKTNSLVAARPRDFVGQPWRLIGLPQRNTGWHTLTRRLWTVLLIMKSYLDRALLARQGWRLRRRQADGAKISDEDAQTSHTSSIPKAVLAGIQTGTMAYEYKGIPTWKNPFDLAIYPVLFWRTKPAAIIEIGSNRGGSALWMADVTRNLGLACQIHSIDLQPVTGIAVENITFHHGDARDLGPVFSPDFINSLPRPLLVIEDSSHDADTSHAVLMFFDAWLRPGEYIVVEDGILTDMGYAEDFGGGPLAAIERFMRSHGAKYEIDRTYCDWFGRNATWNVNGYLRRVS